MNFPKIMQRLFANGGAGPKLRRDIMPGMLWNATENYTEPTWCRGAEGKIYMWNAPSGPGVAGVGAKDPADTANAAYWADFAGNILAAIPPGVLSGSIMAFSGAFGGSDGKRPIPRGTTVPDEGWSLCDGSNDTPDLRDRMIIGAGTTYASGSKGGNSMHSHSLSGTVGATTLDGNTLPYHSHEGAIRHGNSWDESSGWYSGHPNFVHPGLSATGYAGGSQPHTHSLSASTGTDSSLPPYYALAYIMKL